MERVRGGAQGPGDPQRGYPVLVGSSSTRDGARGAVLHGRPSPRARYRGLGLVVVLVAAAALASAACRGPQASEGVGGQSGDEGRRPSAPWLGTGGVAAVPTRP